MDFIQRTIELARSNVEQGGRPFATVIVRDGRLLAESPNRVAQTGDPTAHAEILAIREACTGLGTERRLPMRHEPREAADVYREWCLRNGGEQRVPNAPGE